MVVIKIPLIMRGKDWNCASSVESTVQTVWPEGMASRGGRIVSVHFRGRCMVLEGRDAVIAGVTDEARFWAEIVPGPGPAYTKDTDDP
jgi:hypothetical protein